MKWPRKLLSLNAPECSPDRFRSLEQDHFDIIIVVAGTGGPTAGALLARSGKSVLVQDRHYVAGGNATIFRRRGYEFDVDIHLYKELRA